MKKTLILALLLPLFTFSQSNVQKKVKVMKKAFFEKQIIENWEEYSKAFEYADYQKIASYFTYPLTFSLLDKPQIISNKKELITFYKQLRANVQDGYKYSLLDKSRIVWLSKDAYMFDATYSRYNNDYKRIFQGRGIYMYKKIDNSWKMFSVSSLPIVKKKVKKAKQ
tara:strand:+ start:1154 stop:1654 length:501 start_codon:yes stop_codon:yes gene_type:complete